MAREIDHAGLRCAVRRRRAQIDVFRGGGGDHDDLAAALRKELLHGKLRKPHGEGEVDGHDLFPFRNRHIQCRRAQRHASTAHENVDTAERLQGIGEKFLRKRARACISSQIPAADAERFQLPAERLKRLFPPPSQNEIRAFLREQAGGLAADAAGGAGDQRNFSGEQLFHNSTSKR